jgi:hypothetical protein
MTITALRRRNLRRRQLPPVFRIGHLVGLVAACVFTGFLMNAHRLIMPSCSPTTFAECREEQR